MHRCGEVLPQRLQSAASSPMITGKFGVDPQWIDEAYVRQAAQAPGFELAPAHVPGVVLYLRMIAGFAAAVHEFDVSEHTESATVYVPCWPPIPE